MKNKEKIFLLTTVGVIAASVAQVVVRLSASDAAFSTVPGWHTIVYPPEIVSPILTALILAIALTVYFIFKYTMRVLRTRGKQ